MSNDRPMLDISRDLDPGTTGPALAGAARRVSAARLGAILVACAGMAATMLLPWLHVGLGSHMRTYDGGGVPELSVPFLVAACAIAAAALLEHRRADGTLPITLGVSVAAAVGCALAIVLLESVDTLTPRSVLPATARRLTLELGVGTGLWCAFAAAALTAAAAAAPDLRAHVRRLTSRAPARPELVLGTLVTFGLLAGAVAYLRYQPWVSVSAAGQDAELAGWTLPIVGPGSLVGLWLVIAGGVVALVTGRVQVAGALAAFGGWACAFTSALAIVTTRWLGRLRLDDLFDDRLREVDPHCVVGRASWLTFAAGLLAAGAAAGLVHYTALVRGDRP